MWTYHQSSGALDDKAGLCIGHGYAGKGAGKNNPDMQECRSIGPLPRGLYTIKAPVDTAKHGPFVMWLAPHPENQMFDRSTFGIHGDNKEHPGDASEGCIVQSRAVREQVWNSGDRLLEVVK